MHKQDGLNSQKQKCRNRGLILKLICTGEATSRIRLSQVTGLTKMAVTNIINELVRAGYVIESSVKRNANVGRNPITLKISQAAPKVLGIYLSRDGCTAALFDLELKMLAQETIAFGEQETEGSVTEKLFRVGDHIFSKETNILGCGVSTIGPLNVTNGSILNPPNFYNIENMQLQRLLQEHYHFKIWVNNDMNCAALAEKLYGAGKKIQNFLYVGISNGIGSGIITNNRLYQNGNGFAGELGHTGIDYQGKKCGCGRKGCLECYISKPIIEEKLRKETNLDLSYKEFCTKAADARVDKILTDMIFKLSYALINQVNMINPEAVFIGHEGFFLPNRYIKLLEEQINKKKFSKDNLHVVVEKSSFDTYAPLYGSACIVLDHFFENGKLFEEG